MKYLLEILGNKSKITETGLLCLEYSRYNKFLIKMSNFSKFAEHIMNIVRPVQQNSRHLVGIINKI